MLQLEEEKAHKKIMETKKKTKQISDLKNKNDAKYQNEMKAQNKGVDSMKQARENNLKMQADLKKEIKSK